ncbi:MAG: HAD-IIIC family phosphatase [Myxococcales bacterium]|nr:HAD-IIIC family phosphatase [Myxococcales bacterium]
MSRDDLRGVLLSDFNLQNLADLLSHDTAPPRLTVMAAPYGQLAQVILDDQWSGWADRPDFALVWTRPTGAIPSVARLLDYEHVPGDTLSAELDAYADLIERLAARVKWVFVPTWTLPPSYRGTGLLDYEPRQGARYWLDRLNARLSERLAARKNIFLLPAARWLQAVGAKAYSPKHWYLGKIEFGTEVFKEAAQDLKAALNALLGLARKLVIIDLDDTLWGGIVGDVGWENLALGGHDPVGEAFVDFQRALKALTNRGVLLGIVSKNEEAIALEAIRNHPEMVLRLDDFAGWRINWRDKAQNIGELAAELNLGRQSIVFIDDNPVERARVREALPEVLVPEWPADKLFYQSALQSLRCFDSPAISDEDRDRARMYLAERQRRQVQEEIGSLDDWLRTLGIQVIAEPLGDADLTRTVQLFNKTNQMNLSTRRLSEGELAAWAAQPAHRLFTFRVRDKFGDSGLTGIASLAIEGDTGRIVDFILSCRVMGRKIEEVMLHVLADYGRKIGRQRLVAEYRETAKNKPCLEFFRQRSGFAAETDAVFVFPLAGEYPLPPGIELIVKDPVA